MGSQRAPLRLPRSPPTHIGLCGTAHLSDRSPRPRIQPPRSRHPAQAPASLEPSTRHKPSVPTTIQAPAQATASHIPPSSIATRVQPCSPAPSTLLTPARYPAAATHGPCHQIPRAPRPARQSAALALQHAFPHRASTQRTTGTSTIQLDHQVLGRRPAHGRPCHGPRHGEGASMTTAKTISTTPTRPGTALHSSKHGHQSPAESCVLKQERAQRRGKPLFARSHRRTAPGPRDHGLEPTTTPRAPGDLDRAPHQLDRPATKPARASCAPTAAMAIEARETPNAARRACLSAARAWKWAPGRAGSPPADRCPVPAGPVETWQGRPWPSSRVWSPATTLDSSTATAAGEGAAVNASTEAWDSSTACSAMTTACSTNGRQRARAKPPPRPPAREKGQGQHPRPHSRRQSREPARVLQPDQGSARIFPPTRQRHHTAQDRRFAVEGIHGTKTTNRGDQSADRRRNSDLTVEPSTRREEELAGRDQVGASTAEWRNGPAAGRLGGATARGLR